MGDVGILNDGCLADIENRKLGNLKEKTLSYRFAIAHAPGKKHVGPDAASRYPVGQPDKLEIPDESKETDFSVRSISHTMWDNLTTIEMLQDEIDMFSVASMKNALGTLSETQLLCVHGYTEHISQLHLLGANTISHS